MYLCMARATVGLRLAPTHFSEVPSSHDEELSTTYLVQILTSRKNDSGIALWSRSTTVVASQRLLNEIAGRFRNPLPAVQSPENTVSLATPTSSFDSPSQIQENIRRYAF